MGLLKTVQDISCKSVAVVGLAKNAGKTVTMNRLIQEALSEGISLALTSSGRDGESRDIIWQNIKPSIRVPKGALVATAGDVLAAGSARLKVIRKTSYSSALGEIYIARTLTEGTVLLAGPAQATQIRKLVIELKSLGGELVIVDGAIDRVASAAPQVTEGVILATGAVLAPQPETVLDLTLARVQQFVLKSFTGYVPKKLETEVLLRLGDGTLRNCNVPSAIGYGEEIMEEIHTTGATGLVVLGAVTDTLARQILGLGINPFTLVVSDGTKLFLSLPVWKLLREQGIEVLALNRINLLAVTLNPWSPFSWQFEPRQFLSLARQKIKQVPVYDPYQMV